VEGSKKFNVEVGEEKMKREGRLVYPYLVFRKLQFNDIVNSFVVQ
jgi:hypothetical protein